ncbi:hypothetical protein TNCV_1442111 [Trichonephila clavipes]|uniref:Uncharacterized protein n=1 Tax=Trichonephila clavipes TaxID=2585209 RepID=A0A8X6RX03_TRICX|nr:hypothetical protein TNCV_1442111 [Trichonephila clavipes]
MERTNIELCVTRTHRMAGSITAMRTIHLSSRAAVQLGNHCQASFTAVRRSFTVCVRCVQFMSLSMKFERCSVGLGSGFFARPGIVVKSSQDIKSSLYDMLRGNVLLKYRVGCSLQQGLKKSTKSKEYFGQRVGVGYRNCGLWNLAPPPFEKYLYALLLAIQTRCGKLARLTGQRGRSPTTKNCALQSTAICGSGERQPPEVQ